MLRFFLASLITGSGIIIGGVLSIVAKDELRPGKRYFILLKNVLFFSVMLATSLYYVRINPLVSMIPLVFLGLLFMKKFRLNLAYISFAIACILAYSNSSLFMFVSSLIFFAGFPIGTVAAHELIRKEIFVERMILVPYFIFVLICAAWALFGYFYLRIM